MSITSDARVAVGQHSRAGRKKRNDDSYGVLIPSPSQLETKGIAMAIADGMSSSAAAKAASETCIRSFLEDYYATHPSWTVKTSVERILNSVNSWLYSQGEASLSHDHVMISTFSGVVLKSSMAHIFHVGDTRIYLYRDGLLEKLTQDHRLRAAQQDYLARAMGSTTVLALDYKTVPVEKGDVFIFTTDGIHDHIDDDALAEIVDHIQGDLDEAAQAIVEAAFANGSDDNLTCQIVRIDHPGKADEAAQHKRLSSLPFPPELNPGQDFEGYKILRELHLSKRTQVYLAKDIASDETVVLKTPSVNFEDDATYIELFTREEWVGQMVASPHVLKVLPFSRVRRSLYYATEYFEGQTLRQWMLDHPKRDIETVRQIIEQIVKGVRAFHRKEILHRDLKPENIMIDASGTLKIIDFGSSRVAGLEEATPNGERPQLLGTVDYTAPEYHGSQAPSNRSDIYSVGVIAYELLTGKLPYGRGFANARDVEKLSYIPATKTRLDLPAWIDAALAKAVHKNPLQRTEVLSELSEDLRKPSAQLMKSAPRPLIERDPVLFWRVIAFLLFIINVVLLYRLTR